MTDSVYAIRHVKVHLPDAADGQRRVFVIGRPLYAASAALSACGRRLTKLITQQLGMFNSCLLSHTVYIRMPRTTVTMSLGADWLYLEVFYSHLILFKYTFEKLKRSKCELLTFAYVYSFHFRNSISLSKLKCDYIYEVSMPVEL